MILYLDATALVKLFVAEAHSREVRALAQVAGVCATSRIAQVECLAALARRERQGADGARVREVREQFLAHWPGFLVVEPGLAVLDRAAGYARDWELGPCAAIHLASAVEVQAAMPDLVFGGFDEGLGRAAAEIGLRVAALQRAPGEAGPP